MRSSPQQSKGCIVPKIAGNARQGTGLAGLIAKWMEYYIPEYKANLNGGWKMPQAIADAIVEWEDDNDSAEGDDDGDQGDAGDGGG